MTITLRNGIRRRIGRIAILIGVAIQAPCGAATPNILFIEADDLMPHFMNKLGEGFGHTPNLDRLGAEGVYFRKAVCQAPMCGPSRNGLLTNLYSHNLGFYRNGQLSCLPHGPYDVPQRYYDMVAKLDIPEPRTDGFGHEVPEPLLVDNKAEENAGKIAEHRLGEAANVAFMDKMVGSLLDALEAAGELDNTVVVFFSDHSIFLGNHGRFHKGTLFDEVLSSSLIVRYPKRFGKGQVIDHPVELQDLIPTAFDLAGVKNPNEAAQNGFSLVPLLEGESTNGRRYAFSEILGAQSATDGRYHYIVSEGYEMLYDQQADPGEMKNIADAKPEVAEKFRTAVKSWLESTGPVHPPKTF